MLCNFVEVDPFLEQISLYKGSCEMTQSFTRTPNKPEVFKTRLSRKWSVWTFLKKSSAEWLHDPVRNNGFCGRKLQLVPFEEARRQRSGQILSATVGLNAAGRELALY